MGEDKYFTEELTADLEELKAKFSKIESLEGLSDEKVGSRENREKLFHLLDESVSDVIVTFDMNLRRTYVSPSIERMLGYTVEEFFQIPLDKIVTPESLDIILKTLQEEMALEAMPDKDLYRCRTMELNSIHKKGHLVLNELKVSFLRDSSQKPVGILGIKRDITDRKHEEEKLVSAYRRLTEIIDFLPDATFVIDREKRVIAWNRAIEEMTGVAKKEILGKGNYAYSVPFHGEPRPGLIDSIGLDGDNIPYRYEQIKTMGHTLYAESYNSRVFRGKGAHLWIKASPLFDSDGNLAGAIESIRDITEYKRMDHELRKHQDHLEELVRERTREIVEAHRQLEQEIAERKQMEKEMARLDRLNMVGKMAAVMGHEIRNPMTAVRGFLQMLRSKEGCDRYGDYFDLIIDELDRTNEVISEFLSTAKDKYVEMKLQSLNSIIEAISPLIMASASNKKCTVTIKLDNIPPIMLCEKEMRQLILNLARNGLDAMQQGGIMTISTIMSSEDVVLSVQDQGSGIDPAILDRIGTPFLTTKETGTGLGLAICYGIAERHNATIEVDTGPSGTTFFVRFKKS